MTREEFEKGIGHPVTDDEIENMKIELSYLDFVDYAAAVDWEVDGYEMWLFVHNFVK